LLFNKLLAAVVVVILVLSAPAYAGWLLGSLYIGDALVPFGTVATAQGGTVLWTQGTRIEQSGFTPRNLTAGVLHSLSLEMRLNPNASIIGPHPLNDLTRINVRVMNTARTVTHTEFQISIQVPHNLTTTWVAHNFTYAFPVTLPNNIQYIWQVEVAEIGLNNAGIQIRSQNFFIGITNPTFTQHVHQVVSDPVDIQVGNLMNLRTVDLIGRAIPEVTIGQNDAIQISYYGIESMNIRQSGGASIAIGPVVQLHKRQIITLPQSAFTWANNTIVINIGASSSGLQMTETHIRVNRSLTVLPTGSFDSDLNNGTFDTNLTVSGTFANLGTGILQLRLFHPLTNSERIMTVTSSVANTWSHNFSHGGHGAYNLTLRVLNGGIATNLAQINYTVNQPVSLSAATILTPRPGEELTPGNMRVTGSLANIPADNTTWVQVRLAWGAVIATMPISAGSTMFDVLFSDLIVGNYEVEVITQSVTTGQQRLAAHAVAVIGTEQPPTVDPNADIFTRLIQSVDLLLWWVMSPFRAIGNVGSLIITTITESYRDGVSTFVAMMGIFYSVMPEPMANAITILVNVTVLVTVIKLVRG